MHTKHQNRTNYYGFRHVIDAPAEKYFSESPYSYAGNDPVNKYDVAGLQYYRKKEERQTETHFSGGGIMSSINYWNNRMGFNLSGHFVTVVTETWEDVWEADKEGNHINFLGTQKISESSRTVWVRDDKKTDGNEIPPDGGDGEDKKKDKTDNILNTINNYLSITGLFTSAAKLGSNLNSNNVWKYGTKFKSAATITAEQNALAKIWSARWGTAGKIFGYGSGMIYLSLAVMDFSNGNDIEGVGNVINGVMSVYMVKGGPLGFYSGVVYFGINETIGWREMGRRQYQVIQNNPNWWRVYAH